MPRMLAAMLNAFADRREYPRHAFDLAVRYMINGVGEAAARLLDISLGGAAFACAGRPRVGDKVLAYVDALERFQGRVVRLFRGGFAVKFELGDRKRERLSRAIALRAAESRNPAYSGQRQLARRDGAGKSCACILPGGGRIDCTVVNFSVVGAYLRAPQRPPVGSMVETGKAQARVVRHTEDGFAVEFTSYWENLPLWFGTVPWVNARQ